MAEGPSRISSRQVKPRRDPNFVYEEDALKFLNKKGSKEKIQHHLDTDSNSLSTASENPGKDNTASVYWSDIDLPLINNSEENVSQKLIDENIEYLAYLQQVQDNQRKEEEYQLCFVNNESDSRKASSTRFDF